MPWWAWLFLGYVIGCAVGLYCGNQNLRRALAYLEEDK